MIFTGRSYSGEIVSYDKISTSCLKRMDERHDNLAIRLDVHDAKLDKIIEVVSRLTP